MENSLNLPAWRNSRVKVDKVVKTIIEYNMTADNKNIVVGISGGADSVCLLHILCAIKEEFDLNIFACHLNHMLRGNESDRDEEFCKRICEQLNVPLEISRVDVSNEAKKTKYSIELCARKIRYEFFEKSAKKHNAIIATAHTMSDSMETVVFNIMRGTSLKGICGIPPKRDNIIRPLINLTREEVEEYCKENNLDYVTDSTNLSDEYSRNFIRHNIIPLLKEKSGNFITSFSHMTKTLSKDNEYLEICTQSLLESAKCETGYLCDVISKAHPALFSRAVATLLKQNNLKESYDAIFLISNAISSGEGKVRLSKSVYATAKNGIFFFENACTPNPYFEVEFENNVAKLPFQNKKVVLCEENKENLLIFREFPVKHLKNYFDYGKIKGKMFARQRKDGDKVLLYNRGCTKSLKKLFNEARISLPERFENIIVCDDEGIVWVENFGVSQRCCVDENTKTVFEIKIVT